MFGGFAFHGLLNINAATTQRQTWASPQAKTTVPQQGLRTPLAKSTARAMTPSPAQPPKPNPLGEEDFLEQHVEESEEELLPAKPPAAVRSSKVGGAAKGKRNAPPKVEKDGTAAGTSAGATEPPNVLNDEDVKALQKTLHSKNSSLYHKSKTLEQQPDNAELKCQVDALLVEVAALKARRDALRSAQVVESDIGKPMETNVGDTVPSEAAEERAPSATEAAVKKKRKLTGRAADSTTTNHRHACFRS